MSSSDLTVLRYVPEATIGVTPANPPLTQIRFTGESLNFNIENTKTAEIRPDRTETDLVQTAATAAGDINIELSYGSFTDFMSGVMCNEWTVGTGDSSELINGTVRKYFTIQKHFQDMAIPQYHNYKGCMIEGLSLKMEIGKIIEGSFNIMAFGPEVVTTQIDGATFIQPNDNTPMNAVANFSNLIIDSVPYSGCISSLSLSIKNNLRAIQCLGSLKPRDMKLGTIEITGDMEFYFNEGTNFTNFVAGTEFDFSFTLTDGDGNAYTIVIARAKFESGEVVAGGRNTDVMFSAKYRALYDSSAGNVLKFIANPANVIP